MIILIMSVQDQKNNVLSSSNKSKSYDLYLILQALVMTAPFIESLPDTPDLRYISADKISQYLEQFQQISSVPYIHHRLISFSSGEEKANWRSSLNDIDHRDTYTYFTRANKSKKCVSIATFSTPLATWVGQSAKEWDQMTWHVWGIALINQQKGQGKDMILWDCDPVDHCLLDHTRIRYLLPFYQRKFINHIRSIHNILSIWYNIDNTYSKQDKCMFHTMKWVEMMALVGDIPLGGDSDLRLRACKPLPLLW